MNNTVYDVDFTRALPAPLRDDKNMLALGRVIASELQENIRLSKLAIIYARIDELEEDVLDILARDLHVDWYEDSYPIAAKRAVIKDSVRVHKRLGTKFAVVTALGSVFPHTEVQEWFEYGGKHHCFRIILDMTNAKANADLEQILKTAQFYKRLTAHLDEVIFQMSATIDVFIHTDAYRYRQGMTGKYAAGTRPERNVAGGGAGALLEVRTAAAGHSFHSQPAGTKPRRNTSFEGTNDSVSADTTAEAFLYAVNMTGKSTAGTEPHISTGGKVLGGGVVPVVTAEGFSFRVKRCGTSKTKG